MIISCIELTNYCNLSCPKCPVSKGINYPRGFISLHNFLKGLKYSGEDIELAVHGESLLHPEICYFIDVAKKRGKNVSLHTNGLLLTDEMCHNLIKSDVDTVQVSFHTEESFLNYIKFFDINLKQGFPVRLLGEFLWHERFQMKEWVLKHRVDIKYLMGVNISPTHNWALDNSKPNDYMKKCFFINNNLCLMKWDGNIISCCFDFDGINIIGHVDNFENLKHRTDYKLCETCSSAWVNQQNDIYYTFPTTLKVAGLE